MKIQFITRIRSTRITKQAKLVNIYIYIYHVKLHENFSIISKYEELNIIKR